MGAKAKPLKDTEVEQIAKFLSGLQGDLRTVPNAKFR